jgi:hypothetical protein
MLDLQDVYTCSGGYNIYWPSVCKDALPESFLIVKNIPYRIKHSSNIQYPTSNIILTETPEANASIHDLARFMMTGIERFLEIRYFDR